jgi:Peptidase M50B-like
MDSERVSTVAHELAHAVVAMALGYTVSEVQVGPLGSGGVDVLGDLSPIDCCLIAAAGMAGERLCFADPSALDVIVHVNESQDHDDDRTDHGLIEQTVGSERAADVHGAMADDLIEVMRPWFLLFLEKLDDAFDRTRISGECLQAASKVIPAGVLLASVTNGNPY